MDNSQNTTPPPVPVSNQTLTMDPNQMSLPQAQKPLPQAPQGIQAPPQYRGGGPHKEVAPVPQAPVAEYIRPTEVTPQLHPELQEAGVETVENKEQPILTQDHKQAGIEYAREATPVVIPQPTTITLPYALDEAKQITKKVSTSESKHWLAALTEYIVRKLQAVSA
ncbi:MAG: hypothetical protein HZC02_05250 [Candidatus Levybacteria bacterium]|nr:hypothetical protein [Candidatus Levybacteria bacterium]